MKVTFITTTS